MDYIGYTSVISGGDSPVVYDYIKWNYGAEDGGEDTVTYPLGYFFSGDTEDKKYMLTVPAEQTHRQLSAQYPTEEMIERSAPVFGLIAVAVFKMGRCGQKNPPQARDYRGGYYAEYCMEIKKTGTE